MLDARPVQGTFRRLRWIANAVLIAILMGIPWIRIHGEPLVLLDIPARKFHVFGLVIFPQELFFLWLLLAGLALALFFFTAILGRLWCGWACPQTVFTDVFAAIARWIQGWSGRQRPKRIALWRHAATHASWLLLSAVVGFHLVGYFRSPYELLEHLTQAEGVGATTLGFLVASTAVVYLDFGIVRQTFCKFLCPYARFQSVLFDRDTLVVGYDEARGEPRGKKASAAGDCVDCGLCVRVCPTGIDIRDGMQMECIACTQCIDACNEVMAKVDRPANLIGYRSLVGLAGERPPRLLRTRTAIYGALLLLVSVSFGVSLAQRRTMDLFVSHTPNALYSELPDGRVANAFDLRVENRGLEARSFLLVLDESLGLDGNPRFELIAGLNPIEVPGASAIETRVFVVPVKLAGTAAQEIQFTLEALDGSDRPLVRPARYVSPKSGGDRNAG